MSKLTLACVMCVVGLATMLMFSGNANGITVDFENSDYVIDEALTTETTLSDGSHWLIGDDDDGYNPDDGTAMIVAPASSAGDWGSKCVEYQANLTGGFNMRIAEINGLASGPSQCTVKYDVRFVGSLPSDLFLMDAIDTGGLNGATIIRCARNATGVWELRISSTITGATVKVDTDYQIAMTYDSVTNPGTEAVTVKIVEDPYGTPVTVYDSEVVGGYTAKNPGPIVALLIFVKVGAGTTANVQFDNIVMESGLRCDDWMLF